MTRLHGHLGGRTNIARPYAPVAKPVPIVAAIAPDCLTESFDTTDGTTIGPDLTWLTTTYSTMRCVPEIKSNALAMNGSESLTVTGRRSYSTRAETDAGFSDMAVQVTWANVAARGTGTGQVTDHEIGVYARILNSPGGIAYSADPGAWQGGTFIGYWFKWGDSGAGPYVELQIGWVDASGPDSGELLSVALYPDGGHPAAIPAPTSGDVLSLTVTGTGDATQVTGAINGATVLSLTGADIVAIVSSFVPTADADDFSLGERGGVSQNARRTGTGWTTAHDYVDRLDNFSVCRA